MVLKMPRSIGIRCGVKITDTGLPATSVSACSISGVCRCVPTQYAETLSLHSGKCVSASASAPPRTRRDLLSMMMPASSIRSVRDQRGQAEDRRLRIAARVGDQLRAVDLLAVDLGQAVHRVGEVRRVVVRLLVPLLINLRVAQPVVGAQIDDADAAFEQRRDRSPCSCRAAGSRTRPARPSPSACPGRTARSAGRAGRADSDANRRCVRPAAT